jgi:hypothetical protein
MKISETIQSNEFTRESRSCGISRCCRVSQIAFPKTIPAAKSALPRAITSAGSGGTSARSGSAPSDHATIARSTGLLGLKRRARRPPSKPPIRPAREDDPPRCRAAELVGCDPRAEHEHDPDADVRDCGGEKPNPEPDVRPGLPCAVEQVGQEMLARRRLPSFEPQAREEEGTDREAQRVDCVDDARFEERHQDARERRSTDVRRALRDLQQRVGLLKLCPADRLGDEAGRRRCEERLRGSEERRRHDEHPDLHDPREQRNGN